MVTISNIDAFQAGEDSADFGIHLAAAARNFTCGVFKNYPGAFIPNAADDFVQGIWTGFCQNSSGGLPAAPTPPFTGGQCPISYSLHITYVYTFPGGASGEADDIRVYGPISQISPSTDVDANGFNECWTVKGFDFTGAPVILHSARGGGHPYTITGFAVSLSPSFGQPDNCGDPGKQYPIVTPPPGYNIGPFDITIPGGGGLAPSTGAITVPVGLVNVIPQLHISGLSPSLIGDVDLTVDLGGIHFNEGADLSEVSKAIAQIKKNTDKPLKPTDGGLTPNPQPPGDNKKTGKSGLAYVQINLTTFPSRGKMQLGGGSAPNVYYAGWFEYLLGGEPLGREPIWFDGHIFINEQNADGYAYTIANGAVGFATEFMSAPS